MNIYLMKKSERMTKYELLFSEDSTRHWTQNEYATYSYKIMISNILLRIYQKLRLITG